MLDEHALQAAILASIRNPAPPAPPTRPEPRRSSTQGSLRGAGGPFARRSGPGPTVLRTSSSSRPRGRAFDEYAQMKRSLEHRERAPSRAAASGRRDALRREGIMPAPGRRQQHAPAGRGAPRDAHGGETASHGPDTSPESEEAAKRGRAVWRSAALGRGWTGHAERARGVSARHRSGSLRVCGLHTVVEAQGPGMYMCTQPVRAGASFNLQADVKCTRSGEPGPSRSPGFFVVFAFRSPSDCCWVHANVTSRTWRLERRRGGEVSNIASAPDPGLRANAFYTVLLQLRGGEASLDVNGTPVFTSVRFARDPPGPCEVGVAALRGRVVLKNWQVTDADNGNSGGGGSSSNGSASGAAAGGGDPAAGGVGRTEVKGDSPMPHDERPAPAPFRGGNPALVDAISRDMVQRELGVSFADIAALEDAKRLLNEAVVLPLLVPEFFTGIRVPWKGVLLFGPPGTGKTLLAKAVAGSNKATFFNCSASSLVSKYRGESERLIRTLFEMARHYAPSIVFIDEIDALANSRSRDEHEASRRFKAELLVQMDGLTSASDSSGHVMVLATSNCPWDIDEALRRRLEKRIYIPLPSRDARLDMLKLNVKDINIDAGCDLEALATRMNGYSGADIHIVCREASMAPMRRLLSDKSPEDIARMRADGTLQTPPVMMQDFEEAISRTQSSVAGADLKRYDKWMQQFGSV